MIRTIKLLLSAGCLLGGTIALPVHGQQGVGPMRQALGISYPEGKKIEVILQGTDRLPGAGGEAEVKREKGVTVIDVRLNQLKPAYMFGGDYSTYVLWTVSPEGHADNVGEIIQDGSEGHMKVTTPLDTFGMFVTAEPDYLVSSPSRFVVLETRRPEKPVSGELIQVSQIRYRGYEGVYRFDRQSLADVDYVKGEVRPEIREAQAAINVAMLAGAERYAPAELRRAQDQMSRVLLAQQARSDDRSVDLLARETVRLAVAAQKEAELRSSQLSQAQIPRQPRTLPRADTNAVSPAGHNPEAWTALHDNLSQIAETRQNAENIVVDLPNSIFESGTRTLTPGGQETLSKVVSILLGSSGYSKVVITGYGAGSVGEYFVRSGMPSSVIVVQGIDHSRGVAAPDQPLRITVE